MVVAAAATAAEGLVTPASGAATGVEETPSLVEENPIERTRMLPLAGMRLSECHTRT